MATYEFASAGSGNNNHSQPSKRKHHNHRRHHSNNSDSNNEGDDPTDGNGSLTYSAASSINSAGESTDSSFADIMKVLDGQDTHELAAYLKHQAAKQHHNNNMNSHSGGTSNRGGDERSVAESLAYSTDAESHWQRSVGTATDASGLHGTDLLSTITGYVNVLLFELSCCCCCCLQFCIVGNQRPMDYLCRYLLETIFSLFYFNYSQASQ
jgi:hypothetical protein